MPEQLLAMTDPKAETDLPNNRTETHTTSKNKVITRLKKVIKRLNKVQKMKQTRLYKVKKEEKTRLNKV